MATLRAWLFKLGTILAALVAAVPASASTVTVAGSDELFDMAPCGPVLPGRYCNVGIDPFTPAAAGAFAFTEDVPAPVLPPGSDPQLVTVSYRLATIPDDSSDHPYSALSLVQISFLCPGSPAPASLSFPGGRPSGSIRFTPCQSPDAEYGISFSGVNSIYTDHLPNPGPNDTLLLGENLNYTFTEDYLAPGEAPEPASFTVVIGAIGALLWLARSRRRGIGGDTKRFS